MFFKIIGLIVIPVLSLTCALNSTTPSGASAVSNTPTSNVYNEFLDAFDFGDYQESKQHKALGDPRFTTGEMKDKITLDWCKKNAYCGSPLLIQKFTELKADLNDDQKKALAFLEHITINGKAKHTQIQQLCGAPPTPYSGHPLLNKLKSGDFSELEFSKNFSLIYKILCYTGYYTETYILIEENKLPVKDPLTKQAFLLRAIAIPEEIVCYAGMLVSKQVSVGFDGKTSCSTDQDRFAEARPRFIEN